MKLTIHVEVKDGEAMLVSEGKSVAETLAFARDTIKKNPHHAQCDLFTTKNGEGRSLVKIAKTEHDSFGLLKDAIAWLEENK